MMLSSVDSAGEAGGGVVYSIDLGVGAAEYEGRVYTGGLLGRDAVGSEACDEVRDI